MPARVLHFQLRLRLLSLLQPWYARLPEAEEAQEPAAALSSAMPADQLVRTSALPLLALADRPAKQKQKDKKHKNSKHKDKHSKHGISKHVSKSEAKELQKQLLLAKLR